MPKPYPREFRNDVVAVARKGDAPLNQIAKDFGISDSCLANWLKRADVVDGNRPGVTEKQSAEVRELKKRNRLLEQENEVLRRAAAYLSQANLPGKYSSRSSVRWPRPVPASVACRVLGFFTQGYYKWVRNPVSQRDWNDAHLINTAVDIHGDGPGFGYRFIADELPARGITASENRVWRLCSVQRIFSTHSKKRGTGRKPGLSVHDDLPAIPTADRKEGGPGRDFSVTGPDQKWLTDIPPQAGGAPSEHPTGDGKLYLCAVKDCYSGRIVGYSIDSRMKSALVASAIRNAISLRSPHMTILHSDRGSQGQFRSKRVVRLLKKNGLRGSMGRVGACGDNAAMESFFALLQKNVLNTQRWETHEELRLAIVTWIETRHNRRRRQRHLGKLTPVEFEMIYKAADAA
ncbi:IS3 family transposase [Dermatophilaceae bacterium Sec6.4]